MEHANFEETSHTSEVQFHACQNWLIQLRENILVKKTLVPTKEKNNPPFFPPFNSYQIGPMNSLVDIEDGWRLGANLEVYETCDALPHMSHIIYW